MSYQPQAYRASYLDAFDHYVMSSRTITPGPAAAFRAGQVEVTFSCVTAAYQLV